MNSKSDLANSNSSIFIQQHSASVRVWHWLTFLFVTGSIVTVLFNSILLSPRENVKMVQEQLQRKGLIASDDQAFAVSHEYEDQMWEVHKLIGYGLAFLLLSRIVIEFTLPVEERMRRRILKILELRQKGDSNKAEYTHYLWVKRTYLLFFFLLSLMVLTGLGMAFGREFGFSREIHGSIKNLHAFVQYLIYAFIVIHLGGVVLGENGKIKGLVSGMIHGNRF